MTDQIISVILPVLASRGGPGSVVLLLQLLLRAPEVVHAEPGQDPVGEGGVDVEAGGDEKIVGLTLILMVGGEGSVPAGHAAETHRGAEGAWDHRLDLGQTVLAVRAEPLWVESPGDGRLSQQCCSHRDLLRGLNIPSAALLVSHAQLAAG